MANKTLKQYIAEWNIDNTSPDLMGVDISGNPVKITKSSLSTYGVTSSSILTDNTLIKSDGNTRSIQSSGILISDTNQLSGVSGITFTGTSSREITYNSFLEIQKGHKTNIIESGSNKDYIIVLNAPSNGTVTNTSVVCLSGTGVSSFKIINGTSSVLFGSTQSVSSVMQTQTGLSADFLGGDNIIITISDAISIVDLTYSIEYQYNLLP